MSIVRRAPRPDRYLVTDQRVVDDHRKSWAAAGLHEYLRGRPDNWEVSVSHLSKTLGPLGRGAGKDKIYTLIRELMALGYAEKKIIRNSLGRYKDLEWVIYDMPRDGFPADLPDTAKPDLVKPVQANPPLINTDSESNTEQQQITAETFDFEKDPGFLAVLSELRRGKKIQNPGALIAKAKGNKKHVSTHDAKVILAHAQQILAAEAALKLTVMADSSRRLANAEARSLEIGLRRLGLLPANSLESGSLK